VRSITSDGDHTELVALARRGTRTVGLGGAVGQSHGNTRPTLWYATGAGALAENQLRRELVGGESGLGTTGLAAGPAGFSPSGRTATATSASPHRCGSRPTGRPGGGSTTRPRC
jgi:hypothetical protein